MKLGEMYRFAVEEGIKMDPRGRQTVEAELRRIREDFEKMSEEEKKYFDQERDQPLCRYPDPQRR